MSFGKRSPLYQPIRYNSRTKRIFKELYPALREKEIRSLFKILTANCSIETILFVAILDMVSRFPGKSTPVMLSAVLKTHAGKAQTQDMEILHDVLVELQMAGENFRNLQNFLRQNYGGEFVFLHSCGGDFIPTHLVDAWYLSRRKEQSMRTRLDWMGSVARGVSREFILTETTMSAEELETIERITLNAKKVLGLNSPKVTSLLSSWTQSLPSSIAAR